MSDQETQPHGVGGSGPVSSWGAQARQDLTGLTIGDFRVDRLLGHGGMGQVYLAHQINLDRPVALKVLKPELLSNPTYLARFEKEALVAAKLNHPNIVHIYSLGGFEQLKYIVMEYVEGTNLREFLVRKGPPSLPLALAIMRQAGQAIAAAAELGLVHRDIKPENLLLTRKGQVKVADFGLCRAQDRDPDAMALTREGVTLGTPMYMSPEQVQGKELDPRSDIYSLGVTFYQMFSGVAPFVGDNPLAVALKHIREEPVSLTVHRPDLPPDLVALVEKMMSKDVKRRYQSAVEMLKDLSRIRERVLELPQTAAPVLGQVAATSTSQLMPSLSSQTIRKLGPRLRGRLTNLNPGRGQIVTASVLALGLGAWFGAAARAPDLLSRSAPQPSNVPGLWLADWRTVPALSGADGQYRHALMLASPMTREAAWLAVPARFPDARDWTSRAYVQLVRSLFRRGEFQSLESLASELERSPGVADPALRSVARAAAFAIRGEPARVLEAYTGVEIAVQDPGLNELGLEIMLRSRRAVVDDASLDARHRTLQHQLLEALQFLTLIDWDMIRFD